MSRTSYPDRRVLLLVGTDGRTPLTPVLWRCLGCGQAKPEADFTFTDPANGKRRARCRVCEAERLRARRCSSPLSAAPPRAACRRLPRLPLNRPSLLGAAIRLLIARGAA